VRAIRCPDCAYRMSQTRRVVPQSFAGGYLSMVIWEIYRPRYPSFDLVSHRLLNNFESHLSFVIINRHCNTRTRSWKVRKRWKCDLNSLRSFIACAAIEMSSWISRATESRNAQLVTTAVVSGVVVASAILGLQKAKRMYRVADLKASIPDINDDHHSTRVSMLQPHKR